MFILSKLFYWFYPMVETFDEETFDEETKYECDEDYDHLYEP